ncbi:MAG TPA: hypothetical protein H9881_02700, partial [Candidatus Stackebrandtia excrementipullorum]|nr:hypothetical protein [Candidatus Stackebrandtia excrementipullorum]
QARARKLESLTIRPAARNLAALRCAVEAGFTVLSDVTLLQDFSVRDRQDGVELRGLSLQY